MGREGDGEREGERERGGEIHREGRESTIIMSYLRFLSDAMLAKGSRSV